MFRRWPFFQRLLSWTKPYAPAEHGTRPTSATTGTACSPTSPSARRSSRRSWTARRRSRRGRRWSRTSRRSPSGRRSGSATAAVGGDAPREADGERFVLETTDGEYRAPGPDLRGRRRAAVDAVDAGHGARRPLRRHAPGRDVRRQADLHHRQAELRLRARVRACCSGRAGSSSRRRRRPSCRSTRTRWPASGRATSSRTRTTRSAAGSASSTRRSARSSGRGRRRLLVRIRPSAGGAELAIEADEVIAATGFTTPLQDLPELGVATFGQSQLPALTPFWESATVPGIFFAGTIGQGSAGLKKHGLPANSGAVHGARYNARVLADHIARTGSACAAERPAIAPADVLPGSWRSSRGARDLAPARVPGAGALGGPVERASGRGDLAAGGVRRRGRRRRPADAMAPTLEADGTGAIYPAIYIRRDGRVEEHLMTRIRSALRHARRPAAGSRRSSTRPGGGGPGLRRCRLDSCSVDPRSGYSARGLVVDG